MIVNTKDTRFELKEGDTHIYNNCVIHQYGQLDAVKEDKPAKTIKDCANFDQCVAFVKEEIGLTYELIKSVLISADKFFITQGQ
jgi:NDP-sugar pyrophosphorylase family protein